MERKTSVSLSEDIIEWIDKLIEKKRFASRSHAVKFALQRLKETWNEEGK